MSQNLTPWVKPKVKTFRFYRVSESERLLAPASNSNKASGFRADGWAEGEGKGEVKGLSSRGG